MIEYSTLLSVHIMYQMLAVQHIEFTYGHDLQYEFYLQKCLNDSSCPNRISHPGHVASLITRCKRCCAAGAQRRDACQTTLKHGQNKQVDGN